MLKGLGYEVKEKRCSETCILKEQWPFVSWGLEKDPGVIYFQMFGVWQILRCIFAKHFPLNFSTGIFWVEFNCFIGDSFALY